MFLAFSSILHNDITVRMAVDWSESLIYLSSGRGESRGVPDLLWTRWTHSRREMTGYIGILKECARDCRC
jgi:hypothetical protein